MEGKRKILIVEDDIFIRDIYGVRFSQDDYEVFAAENGVDALKQLEDGLIPDIILLDVIMPGMNGVELLKKIKENQTWKNIPILMLTNISEKEKIEETKGLGVEDYLVKSHFTPSEVVEKVETLLD